MAPKKKHQQKQNQNQNLTNAAKSQTSSSGPKLQISADNENRLRRLLLNSDRSTLPCKAAPIDESLSAAQKAKKLKAVYEKLSCEGFTNDQIELVLSTLRVIYLYRFVEFVYIFALPS